MTFPITYHSDMPLPPQPILTRWGTWLQAAMFYSEHFDSIKEVTI
jgi:hypothetical protein